MAVFANVRGWLECDDKQLAQIKEIIAAESEWGYSKGWAFPGVQYNWTNWVFYGACMREDYVDEFLDQLRHIARLPASDADNDRVLGLFYANYETKDQDEWQVRDGGVVIKSPNADHLYLDPE